MGRVRRHGIARELEGYLEEVRGAEGFEASERTLTTGILYERKMLEMLEELAATSSS